MAQPLLQSTMLTLDLLATYSKMSQTSSSPSSSSLF